MRPLEPTLPNTGKPEKTPESRPETADDSVKSHVYRLVVAAPQWTKEFLIEQNVVRIGRGPDNDIRIEDDRVSRQHAQLVRHADGYEIVDLESANGLTIHNTRVARKLLVDGDVVWLSSNVSLTWRTTEASTKPHAVREKAQTPAPMVGDPSARRTPAKMGTGSDLDAIEQTTYIDVAQYLERDVFLERDADPGAGSSTIVRDHRIPHLVIHAPSGTWDVQFTKERMTIGRDDDNDIPIAEPSVSRRHASIERRGTDFVVRELQSTNGIWRGEERIRELTLRDGDVLSLGHARLVFKGGFAADDLTLTGIPSINGKARRRPVVIVPGFGGSELWLGGERLWPAHKRMITHPETLQLPGDPRVEARRIVNEVVYVPHLVKQQQYGRLGDYLETELQYTRGKDLLEFAYDWRQDARLASLRLAEAIENWGVKGPITILAHSLGTLVTRYYVERLGGESRVERIILLGGPHHGAPKGLLALVFGPGILSFGKVDERIRQVLTTFPSAYQTIPTYPCVTDQDGETIKLYQDESWLAERQRPLLRAARSFRSELGQLSSVPSLSIFGYGVKTIVRVKIERRSDGLWENVRVLEDTSGDSAVPAGSAVLKGSDIHPVNQEHGSLYIDDGVKMRLKTALTQ
jgi:pSer/pThr/pTyr-binding forkhead associated (FHA) protein